MKKTENVIIKVYPDSIAQEMGIEPGDVLLTINNKQIEDVFDYRYLIKDEYVNVIIRKPNGEEWELEIEKEFDDDLGMEFENSLMSEYRSCTNKCIFCFIDQMPPNMRETLYFKDDDSRLSFLQGNYITMTNMKEKDIDRIIKMQLAPINISVQTTNPQLRCKMLNNRFAGEKLQYLDKLYEGHVEMNGQIVCCKHVNDGDELKRTVHDLMRYLPFMRSVSVVPAGISKFREGLYPLELFTKEEAQDVIDFIEQCQKECYEKYGLHFIHASDEWYILAGREFPEEKRYDGYIQLENGVGMMRLLREEFKEEMQKLKTREELPQWQQKIERNISIATGQLAYSTLQELAKQCMSLFEKIKIHVFSIQNDFFGDTITVSGLVTGQDLLQQMKQKKEQGIDVGDTLLIPSNMLRVGEEIFLDDLTVSDVERELHMKVIPVDTAGKDLLEAILNKEYHMERNNENFVYVKAYEEK